MSSLDAALHKASENLDHQEKARPKPKEPRHTSVRSKGTREQREKNDKPPREGTTLVGGHLPKEYGNQLLFLSAEETALQGRRITHVELLKEALNDLFVKKGKKALV